MTKKDLKVGMVVEVKDGHETSLTMILPSRTNDLCVSGESYWNPLNRFNDDLCYCGAKLTKVYGLSTNKNAHKVSENSRDLLWKRPEYYNGKVVCIESLTPLTTKGKIYEFKDGLLTYDTGYKCSGTPCVNFEDVCRSFMSKFIELVE